MLQKTAQSLVIHRRLPQSPLGSLAPHDCLSALAAGIQLPRVTPSPDTNCHLSNLFSQERGNIFPPFRRSRHFWKEHSMIIESQLNIICHRK